MSSLSSNSPTTTTTVNESTAPSWMKRVPMITGVLAALTGFLTIRQAYLSDEAIYHSTQGVLNQSKASDKWAEYQAASVKSRIVETTLEVGVPDAVARAKLEAEVQDFRGRQQSLKDEALKLEQSRDMELLGGDRRMKLRDLLNYSGAAAQLAIGLASIAALTKRKPAFTAGVVVGIIAFLITGYGMLLSYVKI